MKPKLKQKRGIPFPTHIVFSAVSLIVQVVFFAVMIMGLSETYFYEYALHNTIGYNGFIYNQ